MSKKECEGCIFAAASKKCPATCKARQKQQRQKRQKVILQDSEFAFSMEFLLETAARHHMSIYNMAIMYHLYTHGKCEPMEIAHDKGISRTHVYRQLQYLYNKDLVAHAGERKDDYRQAIGLWKLTKKGIRFVKAWERFYRLQVKKLIEWNDNLRAAGRIE